MSESQKTTPQEFMEQQARLSVQRMIDDRVRPLERRLDAIEQCLRDESGPECTCVEPEFGHAPGCAMYKPAQSPAGADAKIVAEHRRMNAVDDRMQTGPISHDEARQMVTRFIASHFNRGGNRARASIPADPRRDDDIRLSAYIEQQAALSAGADAVRRSDVIRALKNNIHTNDFVKALAALPGVAGGKQKSRCVVCECDLCYCPAPLLDCPRCTLERVRAALAAAEARAAEARNAALEEAAKRCDVYALEIEYDEPPGRFAREVTVANHLATEIRSLRTPPSPAGGEQASVADSLRMQLKATKNLAIQNAKEVDRLRGQLAAAEARAAEARNAALDRVKEILSKHERHVLQSPGVGHDCQRYGVASIDDIRNDVEALRTPSSPAGEPSDVYEFRSPAVPKPDAPPEWATVADKLVTWWNHWCGLHPHADHLSELKLRIADVLFARRQAGGER